MTSKLVAVRYEEVPVCDGTVAAAVANDGNTYFSPRWMCDQVFGINWGSQFTKIKADDVLKSSVVEITTELTRADTGSKTVRTMTMLPIDMLAGWLFTIKKVPNEETQQRLNEYRRHAFKVLDEWARGKMKREQVARSSKSVEALAELRTQQAKKISVETAGLQMELMIKAEKELELILPKETKQVLFGKAMEAVYGQALPEIFPKATSALYSATQIGEELGVSANKIGRVSNQLGLKSEEGKAGKYGEWIRSKSASSSKECLTFVYNDVGREELISYFTNPGVKKA